MRLGSHRLISTCYVGVFSLSSSVSASLARHYKVLAEGYFRHGKDVGVPTWCYEVQTSRGSGPGGQGVNSSSNKVELRVSISKLRSALGEDEDTTAALVKKNPGLITGDGETLILTSHQHRGAHQNQEECLSKLKTLISEASWVDPVIESDHFAPHIRTKSQIAAKKKNSALRHIQQAASKGEW